MKAKTVLLVEDEKEKSLALLDALRSAGFSGSNITACDGVRDAVLAVFRETFDLVILDVSLPTFGPEGMAGSAGRAQQHSGGLEVLRALRSKTSKTTVVIVTQHPDIRFEDESVQLSEVPEYVKERYYQDIVAAILYREADSATWRKEFASALRKVR